MVPARTKWWEIRNLLKNSTPLSTGPLLGLVLEPTREQWDQFCLFLPVIGCLLKNQLIRSPSYAPPRHGTPRLTRVQSVSVKLWPRRKILLGRRGSVPRLAERAHQQAVERTFHDLLMATMSRGLGRPRILVEALPS